MNNYQFLCILYKLIKEEDKRSLIIYAEGSQAFTGMSMQTLMEGKYNEGTLAQKLTKAQQILFYQYGYLYYGIKDEKLLPIYESRWGGYFQISDQMKSIVKARFTKERLAYLASYCETQNCSALHLILEPVDFLERFITKGVHKCMRMLTAQNTKANGQMGKKVVLTDLNVSEYEHPEDKRLTNALRGNKLLEVPVKLFVEYDIERIMTIQYIGSNVKVTKENLPAIYNAVEVGCKILELPKMPAVYIQQGLKVNAFTTGIENPLIVLNAGSLSLLSYDELLFLIGHELGHIKSQHLMYHMIGQAFPYLAEIAAQMTLGIAGLVGTGVQLLLYNWQRMSELTADRAGLLVCQNRKAAISALMKCAGYPPKFYNEMDEEAFLKQADDFEELDEKAFSKVAKVFISLHNTHPWTVMRAKELHKWYSNGEYEKIIKRYL